MIKRINRPLKFTAIWPIAILSPVGAVFFSLLFAATYVLIPPHLYQKLLGEPYYLSRDEGAILFIALSTSAYLTGFVLSIIIVGSDKGEVKQPIFTSSMLVSSYFWGGLFFFLNLVAIVLIVAKVGPPTIVDAIRGSISSGLLRQEVAELYDRFNLSWIVWLSMPLGVWLFWLSLNGRRRKVYSVSLSSLIVWLFLPTLFLNLFLLQSKGPLLSEVLALVLTLTLYLQSQGKLTWRMVSLAILGVSFTALSYFAYVQYTRTFTVQQAFIDKNATEFVLYELLGYTIGSYNRFAALMAGDLQLPGGGIGYYTFRWFWEFPGLSSLLDLQYLARELFGQLPVFNWWDTYPYIVKSGLDPRFNVLTVFGYVFMDFGWYGWLFFLPYGFVSGWLWKLYLRSRPLGVMMYPFLLWTILEWRGYIEFTRPYFAASFSTPFLVFCMALLIRSAVGRGVKSAR